MVLYIHIAPVKLGLQRNARVLGFQDSTRNSTKANLAIHRSPCVCVWCYLGLIPMNPRYRTYQTLPATTNAPPRLLGYARAPPHPLYMYIYIYIYIYIYVREHRSRGGERQTDDRE